MRRRKFFKSLRVVVYCAKYIVYMTNIDNVHSCVNCINPSIVINSKFYSYYLRGFRVYLFLSEKDKKDLVCLSSRVHQFNEQSLYNYLLYVKNTWVNIDNAYSNFYFKRGDKRVPVFYVFPCGKCELCREKKSSEYCFRSACETHTYPINPLYVTLTYRPGFVPDQGLCLRDLQNFIKRLRFRLETFGMPTNFRYLAVGEYGSKSGRPHYHIIFWNLPISSRSEFYLDSLKRVSSFIRYAWMTYALDENNKKQVVFKDNKIFYRRKTLGIVKILPVTNGCTAYITKYFRKEQHNKIGFPAKNFIVSSRRNGGIGSTYIDSLRDYILNSPTIPTLQVYDPNIKKYFKYPLTGYIKTRLFPSLSGCYSKVRIENDSLYRHIKTLSGCVEKMLAINAEFVYHRDTQLVLKPLNCWDVKDFLKRSRHFFILRSYRDYLTEYSFYSKFSDDNLLHEYYSVLSDFRQLYKKIEKSLFSYCNTLYLQSNEIKNRIEDSGRFLYYNIPANIGTYLSRYNKYLSKIIF